MWITRILFTVIGITIVMNTNIYSQDNENIEQVEWIISHWDGAGKIYIQGDYAYVLTRNTGMSIVDISDPENPRQVSFFIPHTDNNNIYDVLPEDIEVVGDFAYLTCRTLGMIVVNISDPEQPFEETRFVTPTRAYGIDISGEFAYVADLGAGLRIISIEDPENPYEVGFVDTPYWANGVSVFGDYAYIADETSVRVINVSDRENPAEVGHIDLERNVIEVIATEFYVYVSNNYNDLRVIDVSDPEDPVEIANFETPGQVLNAFILGEFAYLSDGQRGFQAVNIASPGRPRNAGSYRFSAGNGIFVVNEMAFMTALRRPNRSSIGLIILDVSNLFDIQNIGEYFNAGRMRGVDVSDEFAVVADHLDGMRVIDLSDPDYPHEVGHIDTPGEARDVTISGNLAYLADYPLQDDDFEDVLGGLRIISIEDPDDPVEIGFYDSPGSSQSLFLVDDLIYLADGGEGLRLIDVSNLLNLQKSDSMIQNKGDMVM